MINGFWGRKIGMTQVFTADNKVVPVTAVDASGWIVSQIKTQEKDGYNAIQVAYVREKSIRSIIFKWIGLKKSLNIFVGLKKFQLI